MILRILIVDLADLLFFDEDITSDDSQKTTIQTEDFRSLFGDNFLEKENSEPQHSQTSATNFNDLDLDTPTDESIEEFTQILLEYPGDIAPQDVVQDLEENTPFSPGESEIGDLCDTPSTIARDFAPSADDLSNFWNEEAQTQQQPEFDSKLEQDVARALEESLFTAANDFLAILPHPQQILTLKILIWLSRNKMSRSI
ncbi:MAG: hypothetical protein HC773_27370 [Scytonema sp. CRU_2_7]|nr:hypothetical protein [Scytonema sp. CRU_2_7]